MTQYNPALKTFWFKMLPSLSTPLPRFLPARLIPDDWIIGISGEEKPIRRFLPSLRQKCRDLIRGHADPAQLGREVMRLHAQGLYANAVIAARRLAELQRARLGPRHPDFAAAISNLALLLQQQGNLEEAQTLLAEALESKRDSLGETHPQYASALLQMADILQAQGDLDAAERLIRQALDIQKDSLGPNDPELARSLTSHAHLLVSRGDLAAAESLLRRALTIRKDHCGERHPLYVSAKINLALLLWRRGDSSAETLLRQSLAIRNELLGPNHPDSVECREYLSAISEKAPIPFEAVSDKVPTNAEPPVSPILRLSAEYEELSRDLAAVSRLSRSAARTTLRELSERSHCCDSKLKRILDEYHSEVAISINKPIQNDTPINLPPSGYDRPAPNAPLLMETPRATPQSKPSAPVLTSAVTGPKPVPAPAPPQAQISMPAPAIRERDPVRAAALSLLERMLKVQVLKAMSTEILDNYLVEVRSLRDSLETSEARVTPDDHAIVQLIHPVAALFRLASEKNLSNEEWLELYSIVDERFGSLVGRAASKGQIVFPSIPTPST